MARQLPALTSIRFFAALWVLLFHFSGQHLAAAPVELRNIAGCGFAGVSLFFILSGFILTYTYSGQPEAFDRKRFWLARVARVYPVYVVGLIVSFPFVIHSIRLANDAVQRGGFVLSIGLAPALLQSWVPHTAARWNGPGWSLSCEAFFYALFPFILVLLKRFRRGWLAPLIVLAWILAVLPALSYMYLQPQPSEVAGPLVQSTWMNFVKYDPLVRLPEFVLGMLLGCLYIQNGKSKWGNSLAVIALILLIPTLACSSSIPYPLLHDGLLDPLFALLIYGLASAGLLSRILALPGLLLLGEASYSLYILHGPIASWMNALGKSHGLMVQSSRAYFSLYVVITLLLSIAIFKLVEMPIRHRIVAHFMPRVVPERAFVATCGDHPRALNTLPASR